MSNRTRGEIEAENALLREAVLEFHWMAQRYADGRMTYVTSLFNEVVRKLLAANIPLQHLGVGSNLFARDGMGRAYDGLTDEEAADGQ